MPSSACQAMPAMRLMTSRATRTSTSVNPFVRMPPPNAGGRPRGLSLKSFGNSRAAPGNVASVRVVTKLGFTREKCLRYSGLPEVEVDLFARKL